MFDHVWYWKSKPQHDNGSSMNRQGQRCRVLARGKKNTILVQFEDGFLVFTSRYAVRRASEIQACPMPAARKH